MLSSVIRSIINLNLKLIRETFKVEVNDPNSNYLKELKIGFGLMI